MSIHTVLKNVTGTGVHTAKRALVAVRMRFSKLENVTIADFKSLMTPIRLALEPAE